MVMDYGVLTCFRHSRLNENRTTRRLPKMYLHFWKKEKTIERQNFCGAKVEVERSFRRCGDSIVKLNSKR